MAKLKKENSELLKKMESGAKRGNAPYSFCHVGGGFDRNVHGAEEIWDCIEYIHLNLVRRGLVDRTGDWAWLLAR